MPSKPNKRKMLLCNNMSRQGEENCIQEFKAFARGGLYSIDLLQRVWPNILLEYNVHPKNLDQLLDKAGLYMRLGRIRSSKFNEDPDFQ
jgi:hypothetical protein